VRYWSRQWYCSAEHFEKSDNFWIFCQGQNILEKILREHNIQREKRRSIGADYWRFCIAVLNFLKNLTTSGYSVKDRTS